MASKTQGVASSTWGKSSSSGITIHSSRRHFAARPRSAVKANGRSTVIHKILLVMVALLPITAGAATKRLECKQTTDKGIEEMIFATIDDTSAKAEVESFALSAECAKDRSCGTNVYDKDVLPTMIRLTNTLKAGGLASYTTVIDVDRTTLSVVTRTTLSTSVGSSESLASGQCTVKVDDSKKVL